MAAASTYPAQLISISTVNDSSWEPDGVTLQVRFCEGGASYQVTEIRAATSQMTALELADSVLRLAGNSCQRVVASADKHPGI